MPFTAADLVALFDIEPIGEDRFVGHSPKSGWKRVFGGQVIAQALVAASRTVEGRAPHSLHAYFLLGGDPTEPIVFEVERVRDGRSFTDPPRRRHASAAKRFSYVGVVPGRGRGARPSAAHAPGARA